MEKKRKIKYLEPKMKFNPGTIGFEPDLPIKGRKLEKEKSNNSWFWLVLLLILIFLVLLILYYFG